MDGFEPKFKRGYVLLSRDLIDSSLWNLPPMHLRVALYLLMRARSKKNPTTLLDGLKIHRGELVSGYREIAENCSFYENRIMRECGKKKIGNILNDLCKIGFIKKNSHAKGTHISICNYDSYQSPDLYKSHTKETEVKRYGNAVETQVKRKGNRSETLRNTNNKVNNENNENNEKKVNNKDLPPPPSADPEFEKFWELYDKKTARASTVRFWQKLTRKQKDEVLSKVKAYVRSTPDKKFRCAPATWINPMNERWNDEIIENKSSQQPKNDFRKKSVDEMFASISTEEEQ